MKLGHQQSRYATNRSKVPLETVDLYLYFILHLDFNLDVKGAVIKRHTVCYVAIISNDQWLSGFVFQFKDIISSIENMYEGEIINTKPHYILENENTNFLKPKIQV